MAEAPQETEPCWTCGGAWDDCQHDAYDITTCQGCGAYSDRLGTHYRNGEECGQFG